MKQKYQSEEHRELAKDLRLLLYEQSSRATIIQKLGGKCSTCGCEDTAVLEVSTPKGLKACNFKDRLKWINLPGFALTCGNCRVQAKVEARQKRISEITNVLLEQWRKENNGSGSEEVDKTVTSDTIKP